MTSYNNNPDYNTTGTNQNQNYPNHPSTTQPMRGGTNAGATTGRKMEGVMSSLHGAGEQIRGQFNMAVDTAMRDREGQARNQGIIDRGREEVNTGRIIDNPQKRRFSRETYPVTGGSTMSGTGAGVGQGRGTDLGAVTSEMPQGVRLTEGSYGERGPINTAGHPGASHVAGGPAMGGGHYVGEPRREY